MCPPFARRALFGDGWLLGFDGAGGALLFSPEVGEGECQGGLYCVVEVVGMDLQGVE